MSRPIHATIRTSHSRPSDPGFRSLSGWAGVGAESRIETGMCGDLDETGRASGSLHGEVRFATELQGWPKSCLPWCAPMEPGSWLQRKFRCVRGAGKGSQRAGRRGQVVGSWFHLGAARCQSLLEVRHRLRPSVFPPNQIASAGGWRRRTAPTRVRQASLALLAGWKSLPGKAQPATCTESCELEGKRERRTSEELNDQLEA